VLICTSPSAELPVRLAKQFIINTFGLDWLANQVPLTFLSNLGQSRSEQPEVSYDGMLWAAS